MITQAQAVNWAIQQIGKSLDFDGKFGAQCVDLIGFYVKAVDGTKWPGTPGAKDIWTANFGNSYNKIPPNQPPQPGDVFIWGPSPTNQYGHTGIVVGVSGHTMDVVDQNYIGYNANGSPAARHPLELSSRLLGFLRPKFASNPVAGDKPGQHTIKTGETFWALEQANGWPTNTLQQLNPGQDPRKLKPGQQIVVPGGNVQHPAPTSSAPTTSARRTHTVSNGENLSVIAARYGVQNWRRIYDIPENRAVIGANPSLIHPGQVLIIP